MATPLDAEPTPENILDRRCRGHGSNRWTGVRPTASGQIDPGGKRRQHTLQGHATDGARDNRWITHRLTVREPPCAVGRPPAIARLIFIHRHLSYRFSLCTACFRHRAQYFFNSIRSGSFFLFFVVQ